MTVAAGPSVPGNSSNLVQPVALAAMVTPKSLPRPKSNLLRVGGFTQHVGATRAPRAPKNFLVAGLVRPPGYSNAISARASEMKGLRIWERPSVTASVTASPVTVSRALVAHAPATRTPVAVNSPPSHFGVPTTSRWMVQSNAVSARPGLGNWTNASQNRRVPVKIMRPSLPRFGR